VTEPVTETEREVLAWLAGPQDRRHTHLCAWCKRRWAHEGARGDRAAHTCPGCGALEWRIEKFLAGATPTGPFRRKKPKKLPPPPKLTSPGRYPAAEVDSPVFPELPELPTRATGPDLPETPPQSSGGGGGIVWVFLGIGAAVAVVAVGRGGRRR